MSKLPTSRLPVTPSKTAPATKSGLRPPQPSSTATAASSQQVSPTGGDSSTHSFALGDRVTANSKSGSVAFLGPTKFAEGEWVGIILDDAQGKNDGSYEGVRYFETDANRGLFCRPAKVQRLSQNGASNGDEASTAESATAQATPSADASQVIGGGDADKILIEPAKTDPPASACPPSTEIRVGDRVVVSGTKFGVLKYLGKIHVAEGVWCGIQLDEPLGKNDGSVSGKRYFTCQPRYGLFSPVGRVEKVNGDMTQSQIAARKASVSSSTTNPRPLHRSTSQESLQSNLSEFSTSSNSISRIPTRTPAKSQQQKVTNNTNLYATPNTKSLLTQAAATLAAATPSSTQISNLMQTIKEKEIFIEKLQQQREQDRLEFSRAAQQVDEMESRMLSFKQQYDAKDSENEQMKKEQYQTKQRLEDLEFQLEEYKLTDANRELLAPSTSIPEGSRLLSAKEIEIYEQIKEKVLELESTNQKITLEKQMLHDEHRQELKRQTESNENDYKSRLNALEAKHQEEISSRQTDDLDSVRSEYEAKLNAKDKEAYERIEQLTLQLAELESKEQGKTMALADNETRSAQQLKDLQATIEQTRKEMEEVRSQLSAAQGEKQASEKHSTDLLAELKRQQENVIPELEKRCQTLQSDLENRDRTVNAASTERECQYEQQLKDYQSKSEQATQAMAQLREELQQVQKDKLLKEQQNNDEINELKQNYAKLQTDFNHREHQTNSTLSERETQYEQQLKDYQLKLEQSTKQMETVQTQLKQLQEEKLNDEKKSAESISGLKQDHERQYSLLKTELIELQDRDRTQNMALNDRETHYEAQIKEYQTKRDQAVHDTDSLRSELAKLQDELEKQSQSSKAQLEELQNQNHAKLQEFSEQEQRLTQYHSQIDRLTKENGELTQQLEHQQRDTQSRIEQLQKDFDAKYHSKEQTQTESLQRTQELTKESEQLTNLNSTLKRDLHDLQAKYDQLDAQLQQHLTSNEQVRNTNENVLNEKQAAIDHLTKQLNDMQQVQSELIEKQAKQHGEFERQRAAEKATQDKVLNERIEEYETKMQRLKTDYLVERENLNLDHEQEKIRLKNQRQQALETNADSKNPSNVKQMEYELTEARFQIEKLQKQVEANATKDDRSTLEGQINFLNDVIVELRNTNERLKKEMEFQRNPFAGTDDALSGNMTTGTRTYVARLYCDMCEVFDEHDTDDCPKQSSMIDDQPVGDSSTREKVLPPPRLYCEKCEEFDHDCDEPDETY